jgi:hypothetical protein
MKPNKQAKIQELIVKHLKDHGTLDIILPDGIVLEIGCTQTDKKGNIVHADDYCYVVAAREDKKTLLDSYNIGLSFSETGDTIVFEEAGLDDYGSPVRRVDVI